MVTTAGHTHKDTPITNDSCCLVTTGHIPSRPHCTGGWVGSGQDLRASLVQDGAWIQTGIPLLGLGASRSAGAMELQRVWVSCSQGSSPPLVLMAVSCLEPELLTASFGSH